MADTQLKSGDACCSCSGGRLRIYSSHDLGELRVQYLDCNKCGAKPADNRIIIEAHQVKKRKRITQIAIVHSTVSARMNID